jgi:Peptidase inhibitor family I36
MRKLTTAAVAGALLVPAVSGVASADTGTTGVLATYDGTTINLALGWQGAQACVVLPAAVQCYDSEAEMRDALTAAAQQSPSAPLHSTAGFASPDTACSNPNTLVTLYSSTDFTGTSLSFISTSGWANLAPYGFDNKMESWVNQTACNAVVADGTGGGGAQLSLAARSSSTGVGSSWKDRASSINVSP